MQRDARCLSPAQLFLLPSKGCWELANKGTFLPGQLLK